MKSKTGVVFEGDAWDRPQRLVSNQIFFFVARRRSRMQLIVR
jgi:hypothetical protein